MIIGITGGTGFIGNAIQEAAASSGDQVILFSRHPEFLREARRFTSTTVPDVNGCEGLIHLAGESIMGFWTKEKRRKILESRREGTRRLVEGIAQASIKPSVLVSASAVGYYGDCGDQILDETSPRGSGFLSEVTKIWEEEALQAEQFGVRVVLLRFGLVLGKNGGAMKFIQPLFRWGLGGRLGSGNQWMSCIDIHDVAGLALYCLHTPSITGPVNAVMPHPMTNREFTKTVAKAVERPAFFHVPAWCLRLALGDLSHLVLDSQRVIPSKAVQHGYQFCFPSLKESLSEFKL